MERIWPGKRGTIDWDDLGVYVERRNNDSMAKNIKNGEGMGRRRN